MDRLNKIFQETESDAQDAQNWMISYRKNGALYVEFKKLSLLNGSAGKEIYHYIRKHSQPGDEVVFNLHGVSSVDGRGLAILLYINKKLTEKKGRLVLTNASPTLRKILWITEIDRLINVQGEMPAEEHARGRKNRGETGVFTTEWNSNIVT